MVQKKNIFQITNNNKIADIFQNGLKNHSRGIYTHTHTH
jgi:hypothetical protein